MIVSKRNKFVFVSTPKTGTVSMYNVLKKHYGGVRQKGHFHQTKIPKQYQDYFKFGIVRNPYDRAVSLWWSTCKREGDRYGWLKQSKGHDFLTFIKWLSKNYISTREPMALPQYQWLNNISLDKVLRFENINEDVLTLPFWNSEIEMPKLNTTIHERPTWQDIVDQDSKIYILQWAEKDFDIYGYSKDI